jgi:hypothetical protein
MSIPPGLTAEELSAALSTGGYAVTRQTSAHVRVTTLVRGEHHVTFPRNRPLSIDTTTAVLASVAKHHHQTVAEMSARLF